MPVNQTDNSDLSSSHLVNPKHTYCSAELNEILPIIMHWCNLRKKSSANNSQFNKFEILRDPWSTLYDWLDCIINLQSRMDSHTHSWSYPDLSLLVLHLYPILFVLILPPSSTFPYTLSLICSRGKSDIRLKLKFNHRLFLNNLT